MTSLKSLVKHWLHRRFRVLGLVCILSCVGVPSWASDGLLWFDDGRPKAEAKQAVEVLLSASVDGLDPEDYEADALAQAIIHSENEPTLPAGAMDSLDRWLTEAITRYLSDLHFGRIDPREIQANFSLPNPWEIDPNLSLRAAIADHRLPEAIRQAEPKIPLYAALRQALAHYRALARDPVAAAAWASDLPRFPGRKLEPGQEYLGSAVLARRLVFLGDFPGNTTTGKRYQGKLVDGIKSFQLRHGLEPDGVIGKGTLAALRVSPAERVRQIELALERLRWTPLLLAPRMIVINVPEFILRAYENLDGRFALKATMKVVVGKAMKTQTPLFNEEMRFIEFSPYWNIPPSIAKQEVIPRLRREPSYFQQQDFEFVNNNGQVIAGLSEANLRAVLHGSLRIRQRPGPMNPLGDIKFIFPNNDNIYLHHTPTPSLFSRERRDFSHGCIRVQEPVELAQFVLLDEPEWTEERIREAMAQGKSETISLFKPLPVVIAYLTAIARKDGQVYFFPDIYDHDRLLDEALRQRSLILKILLQK